MTIEPCLKFYAVPSQSQCIDLKIKVTDFDFFCSVSLVAKPLTDLNRIWYEWIYRD